MLHTDIIQYSGMFLDNYQGDLCLTSFLISKTNFFLKVKFVCAHNIQLTVTLICGKLFLYNWSSNEGQVTVVDIELQIPLKFENDEVNDEEFSKKAFRVLVRLNPTW